MKLARWPLMGGLLHLVQPGGDWAGPQPANAPPGCTNCNKMRLLIKDMSVAHQTKI